MQTIHKNEDERSSSGKTNPVDLVIYTRRISRCLEGEYFGRSGNRSDGI